LILATRTVEYVVYDQWRRMLAEAMVSRNKEELLEKLYSDIEKSLILAGVSAIEDKLQEGVPETVEMLINSNIRVWVLTGDKKETALNIGRTCRLIEEIGKNDIDLTFHLYSVNMKQMIEDKLDEYIKKFVSFDKFNIRNWKVIRF
jgi:magnesium-transporting ATPase (P-type)